MTEPWVEDAGGLVWRADGRPVVTKHPLAPPQQKGLLLFREHPERGRQFWLRTVGMWMRGSFNIREGEDVVVKWEDTWAEREWQQPPRPFTEAEAWTCLAQEVDAGRPCVLPPERRAEWSEAAKAMAVRLVYKYSILNDNGMNDIFGPHSTLEVSERVLFLLLMAADAELDP